ncbi:MAG: organoarsenical effux MFS transporter ArsJ [bacterium]
MDLLLRHYLVVTGGYWAFTITDGAIRMLVVFYFHMLGYSPFEVAMLFVFYEFFGIVTNLVGGWLGARIGLNRTMHIGMVLQIGALLALTVPDSWLTVVYVMVAQAISGIAKDLNKMSAKASVKTLVKAGESQQLFKWVAILTGSKNALKGAGFFVGAALLQWIGFRPALLVLAGMLIVALVVTLAMLPGGIGKLESKPRFTQVFSPVAGINWLSAARFFLFGSRDVWFVVGLPVFMVEVLNWSVSAVGAFFAVWVMGYGFIQGMAPRFKLKPDLVTAHLLALILLLVTAGIAVAMMMVEIESTWLVLGLLLFGAVFALNSALHSFLVLAYSDHERVSLNVGFYYMANAGGRLAGTILSGWAYQTQGIQGCLLWSSIFVSLALLLSIKLPPLPTADQHKPI